MESITNMADTARTNDTADDDIGYTEDELRALLGKIERLAAVDRSILKSLGHANSKRGKRRALALLIGHENGGIVRVSRLRAACIREGLYDNRSDRANFTQDMRKDAERGLFTVHTFKTGGRTLGGHWRLTERGASLAARYHDAISPRDRREALIAARRAVRQSIVIRASKAPRCAYCLEDVVESDKAECSKCGNQCHATCMDSIGRGRTRCALRRTASHCAGNYTVIAKPEDWEAEDDDTCTRCQGTKAIPQTVSGCHIRAEQVEQVEEGPARERAQHDRDTDCNWNEGICRSHGAHTVWHPCSHCAS